MPSIKIVQNDDGTIAFLPDRPNAQPNQPLGVKNGALVTWNNETDRTLTLVAIDPNPTEYITDPIDAGKVSSPMYKVSHNLTYSCVDPANPQHQIVIV
jgi:hypothetical protein